MNEHFHAILKMKKNKKIEKEKNTPEFEGPRLPVSLYYNQNIFESKELYDMWEHSKTIRKIKRSVKFSLDKIIPESCDYDFNCSLIQAAKNYLRCNKKTYKFKINLDIVYENKLLRERFDIKNKLEELKELCY